MATVETKELADPKRQVIGPADHGRSMTPEKFSEAEGLGGYLYELAKGIVVVTHVPGTPHGYIVRRVTCLFILYDEAHPGLIKYAAGGGECRLRFFWMKSDRHSDQAIYLTPPPNPENPWAIWVPNLVVEIVSKGGKKRDFVEKREEYLAAGIDEYWIIERFTRQIHHLLRVGGAWVEHILQERDTLRSEVLPGLETKVGDLIGPHDDSADPSELEDGENGIR